MDSLFHFVFSLMAGLSLDIRTKHRLKYIALIALFSVAIDVDHMSTIGTRGIFHNVFIVFLLPIILFIVFYYYEKKKDVKMQTYALLLLVMLTGHVVMDMLNGGEVKLLYPFSVQNYAFPNFFVNAFSYYSPLISSDGIALAIYFLILLPAVFIEDFLFYFRGKSEGKRKALRDTKEDLV